jgi:hypothetical protein
MPITEKTIYTRANDGTTWPGHGLPDDPNDPAVSGVGTLFTFSVELSEDKLTKTVTRVYQDANSFATTHSYSNTAQSEAWNRDICVPGTSYTKTITVTA